jgi:hypothetical protein
MGEARIGSLSVVGVMAELTFSQPVGGNDLLPLTTAEANSLLNSVERESGRGRTCRRPWC